MLLNKRDFAFLHVDSFILRLYFKPKIISLSFFYRFSELNSQKRITIMFFWWFNNIIVCLDSISKKNEACHLVASGLRSHNIVDSVCNLSCY